MEAIAHLKVFTASGNSRFRLYCTLIFILAILPFLPVPNFWIVQLNYVGMYTLPVLGLVLLTGIGGLTSFGQAAFVGIGAYSTAYMTLRFGISPWLTLLIGLIFTATSAAAIGAITLRMSGHYLPLATMSWALALYYLMGNLDALGKYDGLRGIEGLSILGFELGQQRIFYVFVWTLILVASVAIVRLLDSRCGRVIRTLAGGPKMVESIGINVLIFKMGIFVFAAMLASVSGWLFAHYQRSVNPSPFGLNMGIEYLFMTVLGGSTQVWGAIAGAGIVKLLEDQLQVLLPALVGTSGNYEQVIFGIMIVLALKYAPNGFSALIDRQFPRLPRTRDWCGAPDLFVRAKPAIGELVFEALAIRRTFGELIAVNDLSFQIRAGQIVGLIGPNGAGKSTTFDLITGSLDLTGGSVRYRNQRIDDLAPRDIARLGVARTFQHVKMVPDMTVIENVALGAHLRGRNGPIAAMLRVNRLEERSLFREAERQLVRVGIGDLQDVPAGSLAMGQQRLLEIARALCSDPSLLLLDEPAAGLRLKEKQSLSIVLRSLRDEGMSILLVEHDMDLVMDICDRIVVMEFGTHLLEGTPSEVQASEKVRAAYLGTEH